MPLCPQITNTPVTVSQTGDFTVTSVVPAVSDTIDGLAQEFTDIVVDLDGKTKAYYQNDAPTGTLNEGDIWFDTNDGNKQYYYNGTAWVSVQDTAIAAAQAAATAAQTTADGKNRIYRQTSQPTTGPFAEGDLWFDTDDGNKIYRYTSGSWATAVELGNSAISSLSASKLTAGTIDASVITVSNINAGNISTGTLNADRIAAASITGSKLVAGTITASQIATGTITATQIASGTITATQISSGYVYAGNISADQINAGTLTGRTVTATSGTKTITMNSSTAVLSIVDTSTGFLTGGAFTITSNSVVGSFGARQITLGTNVAFSNDGSDNALLEVGNNKSIRLKPNGGTYSSTYPVSVEGSLSILGDLVGPITTVSGPIYTGDATTTASTQTAGISLTQGGTITGRRSNNNPLNLHIFDVTAGTGTSVAVIQFIRNGTNRGTLEIYGNTTAPTLVGSSDYRLKENIRDYEGALNKLMATKVRVFNEIQDSEKNDIVGFVAHEFAEIFPDFVGGEKDAVDSDGKPIYQKLGYGNLVPHLVRAIQELKAEINQLKGEQMETELDVATVLEAMRDQIGAMAQENAILKATVKKLNDAALRNCGCSQND